MTKNVLILSRVHEFILENLPCDIYNLNQRARQKKLYSASTISLALKHLQFANLITYDKINGKHKMFRF